jgi:putative FmdB family regulatory protein
MPTYEYSCAKGHTFELFQRISDRPKGKCPKCGARAQRVISGGAGLIFKGSGFYITDYGKDGKGPRKESEGSTETSPKADSADTKPAPSDSSAEKAAPKESKPDKKPPKKASS